MQFQIETTSRCNARCVFCPHDKFQRKQGQMSMELFKRIIDDAATIPHIDYVTLTGLGETLLDTDLEKRIKYVRSNMKPGIMLDMFTNGHLLTEDKIDFLVKHLTTLNISLNAAHDYQRLEIMGLNDYEQVCAMCDYAIKQSKKHKCKILVNAVYGKDLMEADDNKLFEERWNGAFIHGGNAFMHLEGNWAGDVWKVRVQQRNACNRAMTQLKVYWDGRMCLCCFDAEGREILGDLNHQTIRDIYNGPRSQEIRRAHIEGRRQEIPLCAGCTVI